VPLELAAVPDEGYIFTGWSGLVDASADTISTVLTESTSLTATFALATVTEPLGPEASARLAVYPSLTSRTATVEATLAHPGDLSVRVMDMLGREVFVLTTGPAEAGTHRLVVNASTLSSGVYFVLMTTDGFRAMRRLVVAR
jgi:hypothetical protein